ncbi:MAG: hypothetical protein HN413_03105 [Chloroflexi bacterium]|jgi:peptidoglycan LD-endopeptidase LytH|nr:hypothetical protein [Chloroflexota bacterium]
MSRKKTLHPLLRIFLSFAFVAAIVLGYLLFQWYQRSGQRTTHLWDWLRDPAEHSEWAVAAGQQCADAPFAFPTDGYIGFLWDDSFRPGHRHQGIDIFGGQDVGITPVYAAYGGYLTRLPEWKSSLIIRIPSDPLKPSRQIWTYYTHLADSGGFSYIEPDFPPGTSELWVEAGTMLGYQGNYSGDPNNPTGVHLHFSIVLDDGLGKFRNELKIQNTLDPSPYFGMTLNANENLGEIVLCEENQ